MGDLSTEMVAPRANEESFGFAFNDIDFSDRILRLEIISNYDSIASDMKLKGDDHNKDYESYDGAKVVTLHINSAILAAKSPFFYKLFKNGMRESQHGSDVSLRIDASEEATLMELLNFMYVNKLHATSANDLVDLLIVADKFEVTSCMRYSIEMLLKLPMSLENAFLYLELPLSVLVNDIVRPLIDEAKKHIVACSEDFTKFEEEAMKLSLFAIAVILGSEGLQVASEDDVYDFILKWARAHYPKLEERREILTERLAQLICFPNMSSSKLKEVLVCPDFEHEQASKLVVEALFSKVELPNGHIHVSKDLATTNYNFLGRVYQPRCVVYFNLKKDELKSLRPSKYIGSRTFFLGGKKLLLSAHRHKEHDTFGLFLDKAKDTKPCTIDFEFAVMRKSSKEFESKFKANNIIFRVGDLGWGKQNLLNISWADFMSDECDYFIDNILHLRAEITLVNNSQP